MKLIGFRLGEEVHYGILKNGEVVEVRDILGLRETGRTFRLGEVAMAQPLTPTAIFCTLVNSPRMLGVYTREEARAMLGRPKYFLKLPTIVVGPGEPVVAPRTGIRPEVEIGVVVARRLKNASRREVRDAVLGFTLFNDVTAPGEFPHDHYYAYRRDPADGRVKKVFVRGPHFRNKNRDAFAPMGPWIVTADELGGLEGMTLRSFYGERLVQEGTTDEFVYDYVELVEELSTIVTVPPLSVVTTGTVGYSGVEDVSEYRLEPRETVMAVEADRIGRLENPVVPGDN